MRARTQSPSRASRQPAGTKISSLILRRSIASLPPLGPRLCPFSAKYLPTTSLNLRERTFSSITSSSGLKQTSTRSPWNSPFASRGGTKMSLTPGFSNTRKAKPLRFLSTTALMLRKEPALRLGPCEPCLLRGRLCCIGWFYSIAGTVAKPGI